MKLIIALVGIIAVCAGVLVTMAIVPLQIDPVPWIIAALFAFSALLLKLVK